MSIVSSIGVLPTSAVSSSTEKIAGTVIDSRSGVPISGAVVVIPDCACTTFTSPLGNFVTSGYCTDPGVLLVTAGGYSGVSVARGKNKGTAGFGDTIRLSRDFADLSGKRRRKADTLQISGVIIDSLSRKKLPGIAVYSENGAQTFSRMDGIFTLNNIPDRRVRVTAEGTGYRKKELRLGDPEQADTVMIALVPDAQHSADDNKKIGITIFGRISDSVTEGAVAGAVVHFSDNTRAFTDMNGRYRIEKVGSGVGSFLVAQEGYDTLRKEVTLSGTDSLLQLDMVLTPVSVNNTAGSVAGRVVAASGARPVPGATVAIEQTGQQTNTDSIGYFRLAPENAAPLTIIVSGPGFAPEVVTGVVCDTFLAVHLVADTSSEARVRAETLRSRLSKTVATTEPVSFLVVEKEGGFPVATAAIRLDGKALSGITGSDGVLSSEVVEPGLREVTVIAKGYDTLKHARIPVGTEGHKNVTLHLVPSSTFTIGRNARLYGVVKLETGERLGGVRVVLQGTKKETITNLDGRYHFTGLRPDVYHLSIDYQGYTLKKQPEITLSAGTTAGLDLVAVRDTTAEMQRMYVGGTVATNTDAGLLRERQLNTDISDAIGSDLMSKAGASNAADAVKKVTGVTIIDGKYVYIRGMGERYVGVTLNDQSIPSPDPDKRSFPLDLFPTGLLENIVTEKTFSADKSGNFAGGNVNIATRSIPEKPHFSLSIGSGANTNVTGRQILSYEGGKLDWLGIDDGTRAEPEIVRDKLLPTYSTANQDSTVADSLDQYSKAFNNRFYLKNVRGLPDASGKLSMGNRFELDDGSVGGLLSFTYSKKTGYYRDGQNNRYEATGNSAQSQLLIPVEQYRSDERAVSEVLWGGLATVGGRFSGDNHRISLNALYVHNGEDETRYLIGKVKNLDFDMETRLLKFSERDLFDLQADGTHLLSETALPFLPELRWSASWATTSQNQPDTRIFLVEHAKNEDSSTAYRFPGTYPLPSRYYRTLGEQGVQMTGDVIAHLDNEENGERFIKLGMALNNRNRTYIENYYVFSNISEESSLSRFDGDVAAYYDSNNRGLIGQDVKVRYDRPTRRWDTSFVNTWGVVVDDVNFNSDYQSRLKTLPAWYGLVSWRFSDFFKLSGGVRYEHTLQDLVMADTSLMRDDIDWLPSVNIIVSPVEKMDIRLVAGRTLARPIAREIAPIGTFDAANNTNFVGNPDLVRTQIDNYDLRWEWMQGVSGMLAASAFVKYMRHPIELVIINDNGTYQYNNVDEGILFGCELEGRLGLEQLIAVLKGLQVSLNAAFIYSAVDLGETELADKRQWDPDIEPTRPLQGQSPYVINCNLMYDNETWGLAGGLFFNVFGPRLSAVSKKAAPDVYEQPAWLLDGGIEKKFGERWSVKLQCKNILDPKIKKTYTYKGKEYFYSLNRKGRSFSFSAGYSL
ncbi:MAG: carboxypeptidase-like regulatory domain-containing protein [Chitinispirillaceae bacterium]|nr:carboxypeptidase-like regulatory domain-containing protein [Chitinispirillaceae bacterium]